MEHSLLIIGDSLSINDGMLDCLRASYQEHFKEHGDIYFLSKNDKDLPFVIEQLAQKYTSLTLAVTDSNYSVVSKIIATLSEDILELKDGELVPSRSNKIKQNTFLVKIKNVQINVLKIEKNNKIPKLLCTINNDNCYFTLLGTDEDLCKVLLEPLAKTFDIKLIISPIIKEWCLVEARSNKFGQIEGFIQGARALFLNKLILGKDPIEYIVNMLIKQNVTITAAESCTGGLVASMITAYHGASEIFEGSVVTYSNRIKHDWIGVEKDVFESVGAVSEKCVKQMLKGVLKISKSDLAIAISGIAGPSGGSIDKPVGTVYVGVASKDGLMEIKKLSLKGNRFLIQRQSAMHAFALLAQTKENIFFNT